MEPAAHQRMDGTLNKLVPPPTATTQPPTYPLPPLPLPPPHSHNGPLPPATYEEENYDYI